jgi:hypothetical protein
MYNNLKEITLEKGPQLLTFKFLKQRRGTINIPYLEFVSKPAVN